MKRKNGESIRYPHKYIKRLKDKLEEYNTREALVQFRHKAIERQKISNYSGEYDRVRGMLQQSLLPSETVKRLKDREDELKKLGARAFGIN